MKKINNMEELRAFCLGFEKDNYSKFRSIEKCGDSFRIDEHHRKPEFTEKNMWYDRVDGIVAGMTLYLELDINFDCDFSKCCWSVE
jgi:hypothetical protein